MLKKYLVHVLKSCITYTFWQLGVAWIGGSGGAGVAARWKRVGASRDAISSADLAGITGDDGRNQ